MTTLTKKKTETWPLCPFCEIKMAFIRKAKKWVCLECEFAEIR
jgi:ribosomal protein L37AE/L43A